MSTRTRLLSPLVTITLAGTAFADISSEWVHPDASGKLVYKTTEQGDHIPPRAALCVSKRAARRK